MGGGSAEGSEARKEWHGWDGTWDMGWAWACSSSPEAVCMQGSGAVLYAASAVTRRDMQLWGYLIAWPGQMADEREEPGQASL